jgi:(1->4)-alpha-D-glucan 1-alpha-D-glucosylmutase
VRREALERLRNGAAPTPETMKLFLIWKALDLRSRRPSAFAGAYEPIEAGPDTVAYVRGGEVLVVVPVRDRGDAWISAPGRWRDVLTGEERELPDDVTVGELVERYGLGLFERAG